MAGSSPLMLFPLISKTFSARQQAGSVKTDQAKSRHELYEPDQDAILQRLVEVRIFNGLSSLPEHECYATNGLLDSIQISYKCYESSSLSGRLYQPQPRTDNPPKNAMKMLKQN